MWVLIKRKSKLWLSRNSHATSVSFLGLTRYYRRFVAQYAHIAEPLTQQLKKDSFGWSELPTNAFQRLKAALINPPVLRLPNFCEEFVVEADTSGYDLGAMLMQ